MDGIHFRYGICLIHRQQLIIMHVRSPGLWNLCLYAVCLATVATRSALSSPTIIELSTELNVFTDPITDPQSAAQRRYFRYLAVDSTNNNYLYVGAIDHVYRLDASYISENYLKSANLSTAAASTMYENFINCLARGKDPSFSCQNHVRAVINMQNKLFVCATGVDSPIVYYLNYSNLEVVTVEHKGGRAKCPFDPSSNYTIVYVEHGNPDNVASIYSGTVTDFSNSDTVVFRPPIVGAHSREYKLLRTEQDSRWLNDPQFVGSFDVGDYVYFFFREHAMEHANCGKVVFSRVARVCKKDQGGSSLSMEYRWTTFLKARLNCSVPGDMPFYFNEIYDVQYNDSERTFFGLFRTTQNGFWGSAICSYTVDTIDKVLDHSPFKGQQNFETGWFPVPEKDIPTPRPGQCSYNSLDLSTSTLTYIKSHPLLHDTVDTLDGRPLYFTKDDTAFTRLAVDTVAKYKVFFLGSSRGVVHKVAQWRDGQGRIQFITVAIMKPFRNIIRPIWQMIVHAVTAVKTTFLYLATDDAVVQLQVEDCFRYTKCLSCVRDPYCGWDNTLNACQSYQPGLIQRVSSSTDDSCGKYCLPSHKYYMTKTEVLQGVPIHLNCTPICLTRDAANAKVAWHFADHNSMRTIKLDNREYILTQESGLVILDVKSHHNGTFTCSIGGHTMARHDVKVLPCRMQTADRENTWRLEFTKWCNAFNAYTQEYNQWLCLKKQCMKEKCIPQHIVDKCTPKQP